MTILGIETSCDETSVGIVERIDNTLMVKANVTASSLELHSKTGGIIPEMAAREQVKFMLPVLQEAIEQAFSSTNEETLDVGKQKRDKENRSSKIENPIPNLHSHHLASNLKHLTTIPPIDAIAVTYGPGLVGSLLVGIETAKTLSFLWNKPLIPVNHMMGHIYANWLRTERYEDRGKPQDTSPQSPNRLPQFPALVLVVSGGHTDLLLMKQHGEIEVIGGTRDDAAGECFDKCARLLGFPYPGGPKIAKLAEKGDPKAFLLPRPMIGDASYDFSFSGLKTSFLNLTKQHFPLLRSEIPHTKAGWQHIGLENELSAADKQKLYDLCASLQKAIIDVLVKKTMKAAKKYQVTSILLSGGVAANDLLRQTIQLETNDQRLEANIFAPTKKFCTDNGAMIAAAAAFNNHYVTWKDVIVNPELYY